MPIPSKRLIGTHRVRRSEGRESRWSSDVQE